MIRGRVLASCSAVGLVLAAALAMAPAASADTGTVWVLQFANGISVCAQNYPVANSAPESIIEALCGGVTEVRVGNDTTEPIVVSTTGDPSELVQPGGTLNISIPPFTEPTMEITIP